MNRRLVLGLVVISILSAGAWALTHAQQPDAKSPAGEALVVSSGGDTAVLLDAKSGKTWVLSRTYDGESVWLPIKRIDSADEARGWRITQLRMAEERTLDKKK